MFKFLDQFRFMQIKFRTIKLKNLKLYAQNLVKTHKKKIWCQSYNIKNYEKNVNPKWFKFAQFRKI